MTKRELIDEILRVNRTARPAFLAQFDQDELDNYLRHLRLASLPRPKCGRGTYDKYFVNASDRLAAPERPRVTLDAIVTKAWQSDRAIMFKSPLASLEAFEVPALPSDSNDSAEEDFDEISLAPVSSEEEMVKAAAIDDEADANDQSPSGSSSNGTDSESFEF